MTDQRLPPHCRLRRSIDFRRVYDRKRSASNGRIVVYGRENELPYTRLGLSVSARVGPAVVRNRWKRLIREAFRLRRGELPVGLDLVVIPRQGVKPELLSLEESLIKLSRQVAARLANDRR